MITSNPEQEWQEWSDPVEICTVKGEVLGTASLICEDDGNEVFIKVCDYQAEVEGQEYFFVVAFASGETRPERVYAFRLGEYCMVGDGYIETHIFSSAGEKNE